ncbi:hypothetical protein K443DRAFT_101247, partial [Laccaria amethystina LaAM-08-1]
ICKLDVVDALTVLHFEHLIINVFGMPNCFFIVHVFTIMEVPLSQAHIGPCLKC